MMVGPASSCSPTTPTRRVTIPLTARISSTIPARSPILRQAIRKSKAETEGFSTERSRPPRRHSPHHGPQGRRLAVGVGQRRDAEPLLDRLEDRAEVVGVVIDEPALDGGADDDQRDARPRSPTVADLRRDVVPVPAVL